jgi:peptidoglycan/xylan/chitin deacetylase (PgdA/CDA1 family)
VAFKVSQIQDYWLNSVQMGVIDEFKTNRDPVSIGVIGGSTLFGSDQTLVTYLKNGLADTTWNMEIANNGRTWENLNQTSLEYQKSVISDSNTNIKNVLAVTPNVFMPPMDSFDTNTLSALSTSNFAAISGAAWSDYPPYPLSGQTLYRFPEHASMATLGNSVENNLTVFNQISTQLSTYGFSVVGVPIQYFAVNSAGIPTNSIDLSALSELRAVIARVKAAGIKIVKISEISQNVQSDPVARQENSDDYPDENSSENSAPENSSENSPANSAPAVPTPAIPGKGVVCFRLDDIQDYYLSAAQREVIRIFKGENLPLSIGIISNTFGTDKDLVDFVKNSAGTSPKMEIVSHGYNHEDFTTFSRENQVTLLTDSKNQIKTATGVDIDVFIPPYNAVNDDTWAAAVTAGYRVVSSEVDQDPAPYSLSSKGIYRYPTQAATSIDIGGVLYGISASATMTQIKNQITNFGFSVVMMHPQEFANMLPDKTIENVVNSTQVSELSVLLQNVKKEGYTVVVLGDLPVSAPQ